jgi:D-alanyl-D-alanine carboxypeptidase
MKSGNRIIQRHSLPTVRSEEFAASGPRRYIKDIQKGTQEGVGVSLHKGVTFFAALIALYGRTTLRPYDVPAEAGRQAPASVNEMRGSICQDLLDGAVNQNRPVGVQLSIRFPDGAAWNGASGTVDLKRTSEMLPSRVIRIGSLTKTYTAVVVLRLAERGILDLDDTVHRWFPEYRHSDEITVRMLLNHSSGIPELLGMRTAMSSALKSRRVWSTDELTRLIFKRRLCFQPGTDRRYSNSNYVLLGIIAERSVEKPLARISQEKIFVPLSLCHTYFLPVRESPPELAPGFDRDLVPKPGWFEVDPGNTSWSSRAYASGAMAATASDVLRFFEAVMTREIVGERSFALMTDFQTAPNSKDRHLRNFGLGLFKFGEDYGGAYGRPGLFIGSEAIALFDPRRDFVMAMFANVSRVRDMDTLIRKCLTVIDGSPASTPSPATPRRETA